VYYYKNNRLYQGKIMRQTYIQLCEFSSRFRILKGGKISLVVSAFIASSSLVYAAPSGGVVTSGSATISQSGTTTNITQSTNKASINWQNFSIQANETVNFNQPSVNSITLNRVVGNERSVIDGAMNANGQVWILNSNGVLFGKNASINTAGLLATTSSLSDADFNAGNYNFSGASDNSIINLGTITISNEGYAILSGKEVQNQGNITALRGKVHLVGADEVSINLNGNSLLNLTVNKGLLDSIVQNSGSIQADGGEVYLTTNAVDELLKGVVNNTGVIEAKSLDDAMGKIVLFAHGGSARIDGTLDASGGFIETSGKSLHVEDSTIIKTKEWLIDPTNITIESTGSTSDLLSSSIKASFIASTLNGGTGVTLQADENIYVNESLSWNQSLLTLTAGKEIFVNAVMNATGSAALTMNTSMVHGEGVKMGFNPDGSFKGRIDYSASGALTINNEIYTRINNVTELQNINLTPSGKYYLGASFDASATSGWNVGDHDEDAGTANVAMGFVPIGYDEHFTGKFNGLGHTINGLYINRPKRNGVGLFDVQRENASIQNVGVINVNITGNDLTGGLIGINKGAITNSYATGSVTGKGYSVGGLVGNNDRAIITNSHANVDVTGSEARTGGLVGLNYWGTVSNSYAIGSVMGTTSVGGLVGFSWGSILNSYATGNVTGTWNVGGLVGGDVKDRIENSYATGIVSGTGNVGGLVGVITDATVTNSYATGSVTVGSSVGGLVGHITTGTITNSFWNTQTAGSGIVRGVGSGDTDPVGVIGKTTAELQKFSTFENAGWDVGVGDSLTPSLSMGGTHIWMIAPESLSYTLSNVSNTYKGTAYNLTDLWNAEAIFGTGFSGWALGTDYRFLDSTNAVVTGYANAGTYSNLHIDILKTGYLEASSGNTTGTLTIAKAPLTITATNANKTYDKVAYSGGNGVNYSGFVASETASVLGGTLAYTGNSQGAINAGSYTITPSGFNSGNYELSYVGGILTITPKALTVTAENKTKTYGELNPTLTYIATGLVNGDTLSGTVATTVEQFSDVGSYTISQGDLANTNYTLNFTGGNLEVTKRAITLDATNSSKVYGEINPTLAYTITTGTVVNDDDLGVNLSTTATQLSNVGSYTIVNDGTLNTNYDVTFNDGVLTITPKALTVTAENKTKTYGELNPTLTYIATGLVNGDTLSGTVATTVEQFSDVGSYTISQGDLANTNYTLNFTGGNLEVTKRAITLDATNSSKVYGEINPTLAYTITTGTVVNDDDLGVNLSTTATQLSNVGSYTIVNDGTLNTNYDVTFNDGVLTITPKALTVTGLIANNKTYDGTTNVTISNWGSLVGLVGDETLTLGQGTASFESAEVGNGKTVTAIGYTIGDGENGGNKDNYLLTLNTATTTADITTVPTPQPTPNISHIENGTASFVSTEILQQTKSEQIFAPTLIANNSSLPSWGNGTVEIINGGVRLPVGIDREFSMTEQEENR
jgi:filamentous hemagglutinin family protein